MDLTWTRPPLPLSRRGKENLEKKRKEEKGKEQGEESRVREDNEKRSRKRSWKGELEGGTPTKRQKKKEEEDLMGRQKSTGLSEQVGGITGTSSWT